MSNLTDALAPCPFCGAVAEVLTEGEFAPEYVGRVRCSGRECDLRAVTFTPERWNTRAAVRSLAGGGWRPIAEAPMDEFVLGYAAGWDRPHIVRNTNFGWRNEFRHLVSPKPTAFQSLPTPPGDSDG